MCLKLEFNRLLLLLVEDTWLRLRFLKMKKQVTFAEGQTVYRLHQEEAFPRSLRMNESKTAASLKIHRPPIKPCEPQLHDVKTAQIPPTMTAGPFLKHTALTPAQKEYLYAVAASYSAAHVRNLINQHYMNVLHRCIPTGHKSERDDVAVPSSANSHGSEESTKHPSGVFSSVEHNKKIKTGSKNLGKSPLQNTPNRKSRWETELQKSNL